MKLSDLKNHDTIVRERRETDHEYAAMAGIASNWPALNTPARGFWASVVSVMSSVLFRGEPAGHTSVRDRTLTQSMKHPPQTLQAVLAIAVTPGQHRLSCHARPSSDLRVRHALSRQQHDPRPLDEPDRHRRGTKPSPQLLVITITQHRGRSRRTSPTRFSQTTNDQPPRH